MRLTTPPSKHPVAGLTTGAKPTVRSVTRGSTLTDQPDPTERDAFLEWMVGRQFKLRKKHDDDIHFEGVDTVKEQSHVETESGNDLTEQVKAESVSLRVEKLGTTDETVEGEVTETTVSTVDDADGEGEIVDLPFDTVRIEWLQGRIEEL